MRSRGYLVLVLVVLALGLMSVMFMAACGTEEPTTTSVSTGTSETTATTAAEGPGTSEYTFDGTIKIGAINSMTGDNALTGEEQKWAQEKAAADANAAGGVTLADGKRYDFKIVFVDDASAPDQATAAMEKLIKVENCTIILSSNITPINQAAALVADKYKAYFHVNTGFTDIMLATGATMFNDMFLTPAASGLVPFQALEEVPEADRPTKCAVFSEDTTDGQAMGAGIVAGGESYGYDFGTYESFVPGSKDFASSILKFKQEGIDGIWYFGSPADGITFIRQLKEQDYMPKFIFGWKGFWSNDFRDALGADSDYVGHDGFWVQTLPYPYCKELGAAYEADTGTDSTSIGLPYASFQVLVQAIQASGSTDPVTVRDAIRGHTFKGTTMGDVTYDAQGICTIQFLALEWLNGERHLAYPKQADGFTWQMAKPWSER